MMYKKDNKTCNSDSNWEVLEFSISKEFEGYLILII